MWGRLRWTRWMRFGHAVTASVLVEPAYRSGPAVGRTLGPEVADLAALAGFAPDPEQRFVLDLIFALDGQGRSAAFEVALIAPRQNLKTGAFKQAALGWMFLTDQRLVVWSAHEFRTAQEAFRDVAALVDGCSWLSRRVKRVSYANGEEAIELSTGSRLIFKARTKSGGRGLSGDRVVLDEAFALRPDHLGALLPTLSVHPDPQVVYGSAAGGAESAVLRGVRDRGRAGSSPRLAYVEWCAGEVVCAAGCDHRVGSAGCGADDVEVWGRANPLLGRVRPNGTGLTVVYVQAEREALPPEEFLRERLGVWDEPVERAAAVDAGLWAAAAGADSRRLAPVAFGVTVAPDRSRAFVGVAGRRGDGRVQVELVASAAGVDWVPGWVAERVRRWVPCAVVLDGTAASLAVPLAELGVDAVCTTVRERAAGTVGLYDLLGAGRLRHPGGPELSRSAAGAGRRVLADGWVWDGPGVGPLVSVTLASHGLAVHGRPRPAPGSPRTSGGDAGAAHELATAGF